MNPPGLTTNSLKRGFESLNPLQTITDYPSSLAMQFVEFLADSLGIRAIENFREENSKAKLNGFLNISQALMEMLDPAATDNTSISITLASKMTLELTQTTKYGETQVIAKIIDPSNHKVIMQSDIATSFAAMKSRLVMEMHQHPAMYTDHSHSMIFQEEQLTEPQPDSDFIGTLPMKAESSPEVISIDAHLMKMVHQQLELMRKELPSEITDSRSQMEFRLVEMVEDSMLSGTSNNHDETAFIEQLAEIRHHIQIALKDMEFSTP